MKNKHFTLSRKHMRRPNSAREADEDAGFKGIRRVDTLKSRKQGSKRPNFATLRRAKSTLQRTNTLRALGKLSSNLFSSNKSFRKGLSFTDDDPLETETIASDAESLALSAPTGLKRMDSRRGQSFRAGTRSFRKQGTLFRKKKAKKVAAESEYRLSQIVVTPLNQDSAVEKPATSLKDASTDSLEIRASFKDTMRNNSGPDMAFEEARRFLLQSARTLPGNSSEELESPMLPAEIADEFDEIHFQAPPPPPLKGKAADSLPKEEQPFLSPDLAAEFDDLQPRPIPSLCEMLPPASEEQEKQVGLSNRKKHTEVETSSDLEKEFSVLTRRPNIDSIELDV